MKKCAICGKPAILEVKHRPATPLTIFGKKLEDPVYVCDEHGNAISAAGGYLERLPGEDREGGSPALLALLFLAVLLGGCVNLGRAADDFLPDRFGVGINRGELEGWNDGPYMIEPDRDLRLWNFYVEWDVPQIFYEPPRRPAGERDALLISILEELRKR